MGSFWNISSWPMTPPVQNRPVPISASSSCLFRGLSPRHKARRTGRSLPGMLPVCSHALLGSGASRRLGHRLRRFGALPTCTLTNQQDPRDALGARGPPGIFHIPAVIILVTASCYRGAELGLCTHFLHRTTNQTLLSTMHRGRK